MAAFLNADTLILLYNPLNIMLVVSLRWLIKMFLGVKVEMIVEFFEYDGFVKSDIGDKNIKKYI